MTNNHIDNHITSIVQLIDNHASTHPDKIAIVHHTKNLTYKRLSEKSNQFAHHLQKLGVVPGKIVAVALYRSLDTLPILLGILKAGAAFLPIDPDYPQERIDYMLNDSGVVMLVTESTLYTKFIGFTQKVIYFDWEDAKIALQLSDKPAIEILPSMLAYVIYTSGSTAQPKGVMVAHENLLGTYYNWQLVYELEKYQDTHLQMANFAFDVFVGDFVRALCSGGKLVLCPKEILLRPNRLYHLMLNENVTCAEFIPAILRRLLIYLAKHQFNLNFMRLIICGSDKWFLHEYEKVFTFCGQKTRVINSYGVTEATIDSTYFEMTQVSSQELKSSIVPIGKPFPHVQIYILDENLNQLQQGEIGEIYIGGVGVSQGYLNQPELTEKKFIWHAFADGIKKRLYKTGDRGRTLADGNIEFLGRLDNQVKIKGQRIELEDIENVLNAHPLIAESIVRAIQNHLGESRLVAFIVSQMQVAIDPAQLRQFLSTKLPIHMVPHSFIQLNAMPLTPNGKIDRKKLCLQSPINNSLRAFKKKIGLAEAELES